VSCHPGARLRDDSFVQVRQLLPTHQQSGWVALKQLPEGGEQLLWQLFHAAVEPMQQVQTLSARPIVHVESNAQQRASNRNQGSHRPVAPIGVHARRSNKSPH
jgi:hypothetical protein